MTADIPPASLAAAIKERHPSYDETGRRCACGAPAASEEAWRDHRLEAGLSIAVAMQYGLDLPAVAQ